MATRWTLGCDAGGPHLLAAFRARALGHLPEPGCAGPDGASIVDPGGVLPAIGFLRVPEGKVAGNRVHVDFRVPAGQDVGTGTRERWVRDKVAELVAAGATEVREQTYGLVLGHVVMLDPEGEEFCVA